MPNKVESKLRNKCTTSCAARKKERQKEKRKKERAIYRESSLLSAWHFSLPLSLSFSFFPAFITTQPSPCLQTGNQPDCKTFPPTSNKRCLRERNKKVKIYASPQPYHHQKWNCDSRLLLLLDSLLVYTTYTALLLLFPYRV